MPRPVTSAIFTPTLAKYKACSRCKQRKMKCDGNSPCAPCVYALKNRRGSIPQCTFQGPYPSQGRNYAEMEERIKTLENQLMAAEEDWSPMTQPPLTDLYSPSTPSPITNSKLPLTAYLNHLAEVFFQVTLFAEQFIHRPSFMQSLTLPDAHPDFPHPVLLHEICAVASLYIHPTDGTEVSSFMQRHAQYAKEARDDIVSRDDKVAMIPCLQSFIAHAWFQYFKATGPKWRNIQLENLRLGVSQGLACANHRPISLSPGVMDSDNILPLPRNVIEAETRRNIFWVLYWHERWQRAFLYTPSIAVNDPEISQLLPVTAEEFETGIITSNREDISSPKLLELHDTDIFVLQIKGSILVSRIISFVSRQGGELALSEETSAPLAELDAAIVTFANHLPKIWQNGSLISGLYTVSLIPPVATLLLYQYANVDDPTSHRSVRLLGAAQAITAMAYIVNSDYYEVTPLDNITSAYWLLACRTFIRFIAAQLRVGNTRGAISLKRKIEYLKHTLYVMDIRTPICELNRPDSQGSLTSQDKVVPWKQIIDGLIERMIGDQYYTLGSTFDED